MRFALTEEQRSFRAALDDLLASADTVAAARAWAEGDHGPGLGLWKRLADLGVAGLVVAESDGGLGASYVDLAVAHEALGHHLSVGPWIETAALSASHGRRIAAGELLTVAAPGSAFALDADVAGLVDGAVGAQLASIDATRRLYATDGVFTGDGDVAVLACTAQLLGLGERLLGDTVAYARQREQFGRPIGSFQAVKHRLADVRIALDFARPLLYGAALALDGRDLTASRDVSAAKAAASDAALLAARAALQVHGAVGYTRELDLGLRILRTRALATAWGTAADHRRRVLDALLEAR